MVYFEDHRPIQERVRLRGREGGRERVREEGERD